MLLNDEFKFMSKPLVDIFYSTQSDYCYFLIDRLLKLQAGHWGVPMRVLDNEPFYGQDRFDHLLWRLQQRYSIE